MTFCTPINALTGRTIGVAQDPDTLNLEFDHVVILEEPPGFEPAAIADRA